MCCSNEICFLLQDCYELLSICLLYRSLPLHISPLINSHDSDNARGKVQRVCVCSLPGIAWWKCRTQRQRCSRCRWGLWWTWGPWPPVRSWWDETHGETDGKPSKARWSCKKKQQEHIMTSSWKKLNRNQTTQHHKYEVLNVDYLHACSIL